MLCFRVEVWVPLHYPDHLEGYAHGSRRAFPCHTFCSCTFNFPFETSVQLVRAEFEHILQAIERLPYWRRINQHMIQVDSQHRSFFREVRKRPQLFGDCRILEAPKKGSPACGREYRCCSSPTLESCPVLIRISCSNSPHARTRRKGRERVEHMPRWTRISSQSAAGHARIR